MTTNLALTLQDVRTNSERKSQMSSKREALYETCTTLLWSRYDASALAARYLNALTRQVQEYGVGVRYTGSMRGVQIQKRQREGLDCMSIDLVHTYGAHANHIYIVNRVSPARLRIIQPAVHEDRVFS